MVYSSGLSPNNSSLCSTVVVFHTTSTEVPNGWHYGIIITIIALLKVLSKSPRTPKQAGKENDTSATPGKLHRPATPKTTPKSVSKATPVMTLRKARGPQSKSPITRSKSNTSTPASKVRSVAVVYTGLHLGEEREPRQAVHTDTGGPSFVNTSPPWNKGLPWVIIAWACS